VMIWHGDGKVFGACGASSKILTIQEALRQRARVRIRPLNYRPDLRGNRRSPFDEGGVS
jgi:hypothetical protein